MSLLLCSGLNHLNTGRIQGGRSHPLKPTKVALFTMILYNSVNSIRDLDHFAVHCFVSAVLSASSLLQQNPVMRFATKYYWNRPPKLTGWIRPCLSKIQFKAESSFSEAYKNMEAKSIHTFLISFYKNAVSVCFSITQHYSLFGGVP